MDAYLHLLTEYLASQPNYFQTTNIFQPDGATNTLGVVNCSF